MGVQDSTVKAVAADLVPSTTRATAYGVFAAVQGTAAILGGAIAGTLYQRSLPTLIAMIAATQLTALVLLLITLRHNSTTAAAKRQATRSTQAGS